jgi:hypothetical protein
VTDAVGPSDTPADPDHRRRLLIRVAAGAVAVVLVAAAAWILLGDRHPSRSVEAYCAKIQDAQSLSNALATGDAKEIRAAVERFRSAAEVAPVEIEAPTRTLVDYADELSATLDTTGGSEAETRAALADAVRRLDDRSGDVVAAGRAVDAYTRDTCHFDPGASTATTG